jgi:hypothetical protein
MTVLRNRRNQEDLISCYAYFPIFRFSELLTLARNLARGFGSICTCEHAFHPSNEANLCSNRHLFVYSTQLSLETLLPHIRNKCSSNEIECAIHKKELHDTVQLLIKQIQHSIHS